MMTRNSRNTQSELAQTNPPKVVKGSYTHRYRVKNWENSELMHNFIIREPRPEVEGMYKHPRYECSQPGCRQWLGLRMTPTGIFCERCYLELPSCSEPNCFEPAPIDSVKTPYPNIHHHCRDHYLEDLPPVCLENLDVRGCSMVHMLTEHHVGLPEYVTEEYLPDIPTGGGDA